MNVPGLIISAAVFLANLLFFYEVWFSPDRFLERGRRYRGSMRNFLGFSYWKEEKVNFPLVKTVNILLLLLSALGILVSIVGPFSY